MKPLLSVVIPAYNVAEFILPAIDSIRAQSFKNLEIIAVNDGSTDATGALLAAVKDSRLKLINQTNRGLANARNTGIKAARGKYIGFLDGDDIWYAGKAERHIMALEKDPTIGLSYSNSVYIDEEGQKTGQLLISRILEPTLADLIARNHIGNGSTPVIRSACFSQAGLFDEELGYFEDYEMWVRIAAKSQFRAALIPQPLTGYRIRTRSLSVNFDRIVANVPTLERILSNRYSQISPQLKNRAVAEMYRINGRKALSAGQLDHATHFMKETLKYCPRLIFSDIRAMGLFLLITSEKLLPTFLRRLPYRSARVLMKQFYRFC